MNTKMALTPLYEITRDKKDELTIFKRDYSTCVAHFHRHIEILFVAKGGAKVSVNDCEKNLRAGDVAFSDSYDIHRYDDDKGENLFYTLIIPHRYCLQFRKNVGDGKVVGSHFICGGDLCGKCINDLENLEDCYGNEYAKQAYVDVILSRLLPRLIVTDEQKETNLDLMRDVLGYVDTHLSGDLSLNALAKRYGYSTSHFSRLFRATVDCKLNAYVNLLRLQKFADIKKERSGEKLDSALAECGFKSQQSFYRIFEEQYGTTPNKYFLTNK